MDEEIEELNGKLKHVKEDVEGYKEQFENLTEEVEKLKIEKHLVISISYCNVFIQNTNLFTL